MILEPLTPPLLPLSPPITPYIPSSPGDQLELLSEATNSTAAELREVEKRIMKADAIINSEDLSHPNLLDNLVSSIGSQHSLLETPILPPPKRKIEDLKVEGPLTPPILSDSPVKKLKSVSFPDMVYNYIPELPSKFESGDDVLESEDCP